MARTSALRRALVAAALAGAALAGCKENIAAPGRCPTLCPLGQLQQTDTLLTNIVSSDTSSRGFVTVQEGSILVLANQDSLQTAALMVFTPRFSYWFITGSTDTIRIDKPDSVVLTLRLAQRDTAADSVRILVYRAPANLDSTATWASVQPLLADSLLLDSLLLDSILADSVVTANISVRLPAARIEPYAADSGVVGLVLVMHSKQPTMITVAASNLSGAPPHLRWYERAVDTSKVHTFDVSPMFDTFVQTPDPPSAIPGALLIGNMPSARALLRFNLPASLVDSTTVVRATLLLHPVRPVRGRPHESFTLSAHGVVRDFGPKSFFSSDAALLASVTVTVADNDTIKLELGAMLRAWRGLSQDTLPRTVLLLIEQEGQSLGDIAIHNHTAGALAPSLRVTYIKPYTFGVP